MGRRDLAPAAASLRPRRIVALAALALVPCALLGCAAGRRAEPPRVTAAAPAPTRGPRSIATLAEDVDDPDGDGVRAAADLCPTLAEDCDRFHDEDGCPDRDDDGDSIPDFCDECPRAAESWNAVNDTDGCSDAVDARGSDRPPFDAMSPMPRLASIARAPAVAQWVRALQAAPHITRVDVVGEAAPDEPDAAVLALQRAEAAAAAMVARGIAATRVRAVGHAPRAEESSVSGIMRFTRSASSARVSLVVAAIGGSAGVADIGWTTARDDQRQGDGSNKILLY